MHLLIGDWEAGDRGIAAIPGREREFKDSLQKSLQYAKALQCKRFAYYCFYNTNGNFYFITIVLTKPIIKRSFYLIIVTN